MHAIIKTAGENSVILYLADEISPALPAQIGFLADLIRQVFGVQILDLVPSYTSIHISYNLALTEHKKFVDELEKCLDNAVFEPNQQQGQLIKIPVYYGLEVGLDLERLLLEKNLDLAKFTQLHSGKKYLVYALGFSPGFAFLAEVEQQIQAPRLKTPRLKIPKGSVGIAANQTAVYPDSTSGGWNIIGKTPLNLSGVGKFKIGDEVQFIPISRAEFLAQGGDL